jgi:DNA-binding MarR family transcriptional regulator
MTSTAHPQQPEATPETWPHLDCVGRRLTLAARLARQVFDRRLAALGSTFASYVTLGTLAANGPVIQRRLAGMLGVEPATLSRQLERLERDGLVAREPATGDHRAMLVRLTDQGHSLLQRLDGEMADADAELCAPLTAEQAEQLGGLLDRLTAEGRD